MNGVPLALGVAAAIVGASMRRRHGGTNELPPTWYHLTDRARFKLDPRFTPEDNTFAFEDRSGRAGIYLAPEVERWIHGHGYWRPFVVEFRVDPSVRHDPGVHGRWGGELFVPASSFGKLELLRVLPIDAHIREKFGQHGFVERDLGIEFDTQRPITAKDWEYPFRGWRYPGPDVRSMPAADVARLKNQLRQVRRERSS